MRKRYVAALAALVLAVVAGVIYAPSALSAAPTIQRFPIDQTFFDTTDCGFPVQIDLVGTDLAIIFDGREIDAFPQSKAALTNLDTKTSLTVNTAGPFQASTAADGSVTFVGIGPALFFLGFRGNPGITLLTGRFVQTFDAQGNETSFNSVGHTRDICAELAG